MSRSIPRNVATGAIVVLAFVAGRLWPAGQVAAAPAVPVDLTFDGSLLWATAADPERPILVLGWAKEDWLGLPADAPALVLAKNGPEGVPVPVPVASIDWAFAYELRPVGVWSATIGFRPCLDGPVECDFIPLPPLPPRPPKMIAAALVR